HDRDRGGHRGFAEHRGDRRHPPACGQATEDDRDRHSRLAQHTLSASAAVNSRALTYSSTTSYSESPSSGVPSIWPRWARRGLSSTGSMASGTSGSSAANRASRDSLSRSSLAVTPKRSASLQPSGGSTTMSPSSL